MAEIVERPKSLGDTAKDIAKRIFRHENSVLGIALATVIAVMGGITHGATVAGANMINVLLQSSIRGIASIGQAFVIISGGIDVSLGGIGLFCSVLGAAIMTTSFMNIVGLPIPILIALPIMVLAGVGLGSVNGLLVSRIGMPPLIVTLGMWEITKGLAFQVGGGQSIGFLPDRLLFFGGGRIAGLPVPVIIFMAVVAAGYFVLTHSTYGRSVYAVGGNPVSAWLSGINVKNTRLSVFIIAGFLAGLAAVVGTARVMSASMITLQGLEIDSIAAATVGGVSLMGGRGTIIGVVLGALILGVVNNAMSVLGAGPAVQGIVKGAIIIAAVAADYIRGRK